MVKIYTKTGDSGITSLFGGKRVDKDSVRIEAYGNVDELNSQIGVILSLKSSLEVSKKLQRIQKELFVLGSNLATPENVKIKIPKISKSYITRLEKEIDVWEEGLPKLKNFILPGGSKIGSQIHIARSVARRTERSTVALASQEEINQNIQVYLNRLSDWLFVLARYVNKLEKVSEIEWKGRG